MALWAGCGGGAESEQRVKTVFPGDVKRTRELGGIQEGPSVKPISFDWMDSRSLSIFYSQGVFPAGKKEVE